MKKIIICLAGLLLFQFAEAQVKQQDSLAILIVDRMSDFISEMESCSFRLSTVADGEDTFAHTGMVKHFADYEVYMEPSKMLVNAHGTRGHLQWWYNGAQLAYYSYDENNYGIIKTPGNTIAMIDSLHAQYGIEFPAADFFYPAFTDDLLENADTLRFLGISAIAGKEYFHILASGPQVVFQFWISNDPYNLPAKFTITYKNREGQPQYLASFSDWQLNPKLPDTLFDFLPPPHAKQVRIMSKKDR